MAEENQTNVVMEDNQESKKTETKQKLEEVKKKVEENLASTVEKEVSKQAVSKKDAKGKTPAVPTIEREYIVPLRAKWMKAVRYKKTNKAIRSLKEFLARHMKVYDRDLNKIKLDKQLNEFIWARGIRNPPARVSVKAVKEGDIVRVELSSPPENLKRKKEKLEKRSEKAVSSASRKKIVKEETKGLGKDVVSGTAGLPETAEDKKEASEKKTAVVEAGREQAKSDAKTAKHMTKGKPNNPKHQPRKALKK
ncbi:MAG: 50S ribosomal protein L31e [Nanoarchaeota archaeon]|nr:50S ribosomal protein L31e [Nanoarchaeota archaeon]